MQVNGMSLESMQAGMQQETKKKKLCIAIGSAINLAFAFLVGVLYAVWWGN